MTVNSLPTAVMLPIQLHQRFVQENDVTLTGGGANSYSWDNSVSDGVPFAPSASHTYTVTGTDGNGCSATDTVTVTVNSLTNCNCKYNIIIRMLRKQCYAYRWRGYFLYMG